MSLKNISIVLVKPQIGENIGATARVMKNFGRRSNIFGDGFQHVCP